VSLSSSTTRPFDASEFIFTLRCRHLARGHGFARVSNTGSTLPFWPNSGDFKTPRFAVLHLPTSSDGRINRLSRRGLFVYDPGM
jgi:hypothetical protein